MAAAEDETLKIAIVTDMDVVDADVVFPGGVPRHPTEEDVARELSTQRKANFGVLLTHGDKYLAVAYDEDKNDDELLKRTCGSRNKVGVVEAICELFSNEQGHREMVREPLRNANTLKQLLESGRDDATTLSLTTKVLSSLWRLAEIKRKDRESKKQAAKTPESSQIISVEEFNFESAIDELDEYESKVEEIKFKPTQPKKCPDGKERIVYEADDKELPFWFLSLAISGQIKGQKRPVLVHVTKKDVKYYVRGDKPTYPVPKGERFVVCTGDIVDEHSGAPAAAAAAAAAAAGN